MTIPRAQNPSTDDHHKHRERTAQQKSGKPPQQQQEVGSLLETLETFGETRGNEHKNKAPDILSKNTLILSMKETIPQEK